MVNNEELLCVVDKYDTPLTPMPRHEAFAKGHYRRTAHVWIRNSKNQILCQKRSMKKDQSPGMWEPSVAGHIGPDGNYFTGAIREVHEETGLIGITAEHLKLVKIYRDDARLEYCAVFYCDWDVEEHHVTIEEDEVERVKLIDARKLKRNLVYKKSNKWVKPQYIKEMFAALH